MADKIQVDTAKVAQSASNIESINNALTDKLTDTKKTINELNSLCKSEAISAMTEAYNALEKKYFKVYKDIIDNYVKFLKANVVQGYEEVENTNRKYADAFK